MKFGYFDDVSREYVITTPKTPYPWINYLGNERMFGIISHTAGGYSFYKDARLRRITRYRYNNTPLDSGGRYFYINNGGEIWSPGWIPVKTELDRYECRHGQGYTKITGEKNGLAVSQLCFVPLDTDAEIYKITVKNNTDKPLAFKLFSCLEFCLWNAYDDMTNFQRNFSTGEVEIDGSTIYHKTEYRERRNHYAFYTVNEAIDGFDTDREAFVGIYNGYDAPEVVVNGKATNSVAAGWAPIASHQINISLNSGEEKDYIFMLGYIENPEDEKWESPGVINKAKARELMRKFSTVHAVDAAFAELKDYWTELLSKYILSSHDEKLNRMVNIWNPYQCMVTFNMSRSASYFESGVGRGMGFRDSNQDILGFVHQVPDRARERILDIAATQFEDGSAYHQYQPLTKQGNMEVGSGFNDDPLWLVCATAAYIKETGDDSILDEEVAFDCNPDIHAPLFEHLRRSFYYIPEHLGPHGLPLIGRADWNDCLNLNCFSQVPGESFQTCENQDGKVAESIFIAGMFVYIGPEYVALCRRRGINDEADKAQKLIDDMEQTVIRYGYDGAWFLRAYDAYGDKVGSKECEEGKIFIEPQGMCGMAGIGKDLGLCRQSLDSVIEYLDTKYGIVLNNPAYTKYNLNLGEISTYPPGYKENAGIFCHNNPWIAIAETVIGRGDRAFEVYTKIAPAYLEDISEVHKLEPYVYAQMIAGKDAVKHGEAKNSWLTGTASWNFVAISQAILGIMADYDGLKVDPCIPKAWKGYHVKRTFRNAVYDIDIVNDAGVCKGVKKVTVDGNIIDKNIIPPFSDGKTHKVVVELG